MVCEIRTCRNGGSASCGAERRVGGTHLGEGREGVWRKTTNVGSVEGQIARRGLPCGCVGTLSLPDWSKLNSATTHVGLRTS